MIKQSVPLLHVSNAVAAQEFYCKRLGFTLEFGHGPNGSNGDPCYFGISRDGIWIILSSFGGDGVAGGVVNLLVDNVDALHTEFVAAGVTIDTPPIDQSWGTREMYVKDADRNCLRFQQ
ncbi:MAG: VOC family protein [Terracidiphilus sp.]|nr:VOC family protein [Terracidiphilus sp.]